MALQDGTFKFGLIWLPLVLLVGQTQARIDDHNELQSKRYERNIPQCQSCCMHGNYVCRCVPIQFSGQELRCYTVTDQLIVAIDRGFYIHQNSSLVEGLYSIIIFTQDVSKNMIRMASIQYAAININLACLQNSVACRPKQFQFIQFTCVYERGGIYILAKLFLFRQKETLSDQILHQLTDQNLTFAQFRRSVTRLLVFPPSRGNAIWFHGCKLPYFMDESIMDNEHTLASLEHSGERVINTIMKLFPNIVLYSSVVERPGNGCFLLVEWSRHLIDPDPNYYWIDGRTAGEHISCPLHNWLVWSREWNDEKSAFLLALLSAWLHYAQHQYVHYSMLVAYVEAFHETMPTHWRQIADNKRSDLEYQLQHMLAKLQVAYSLSQQKGLFWVPDPFLEAAND